MPHDKAWRLRKRAELIERLGGVCVDCGTTHKLEFDHVIERVWKSAKVWANQRLRLYIQDAEQGLVELRCRSCNAKKGAPVCSAEDLDF